MRSFAFALILLVASGATFAQHRDGRPGFKGPGKAAPPAPGRTFDPHPPPQRPERMSPQDRERLRRDIDDANRGMPQRR